MVIVGSVAVLRYIHILDPQLTTREVAVAVHESRFARTDRLDLTTNQDDACGVLVEELIVIGRALVAYVDRSGRLLAFLSHSGVGWGDCLVYLVKARVGPQSLGDDNTLRRLIVL